MSHTVRQPRLDGAIGLLNELNQVSFEAAEDEQDQEIEAFESGVDIDDHQEKDPNYLRQPSNAANSPPAGEHSRDSHQALSKNLKKASEQIIVTNTRKEYGRLWGAFTQFCADIGYVSKATEVNEMFPNLPSAFPEWIAIWIMDRCDETDIRTGTPKDPRVPRATYAHAQKMRAAISHKFGRDYGVGTQPWTEDALRPGVFKGNPSLSVTVSQYMVSLRRRKVRQGEVVTSARAIDEGTIKMLYYFNKAYPHDNSDGSTSRKQKVEHPEDWAGFAIRMMLQVLYLTSMLCLLRYDEALNISWSDVFFEAAEDGSWHRIRLELPVRKTHQNGGISPFYLYPNFECEWMCPIRAWATWWTLVRIASGANTLPQGFVFRKKKGRSAFCGTFADDQVVP